ncbi:MAG: hypothetical protein AB7F59_09675 [Bdellovibrionales bacterium]
MAKNAKSKVKSKASKPAPKAKPAKKVAAPKPVKKAAKVVAKAAAKLVKKLMPAKAAAKKPAPKAAKPLSTKVAPAAAKVAKAPKVAAPEKKVVEKKVKAETASPKAAKAPALPVLEVVEKEVILTNADGMRYCKVSECDEVSTSDGYCRYHYLAHWKRIQLRKKILAGDKLDRYIEELTARYPDKYLEMIRKDLNSEKDFITAIQELEIDGSSEEGEFEDDARSYIDEVRGVTSSEGGGSGSDDEF